MNAHEMTESEYWEYCTLYSRPIFVREQIDGKWDSVSLEDLPPERRVYHIKKMMKDVAIKKE